MVERALRAVIGQAPLEEAAAEAVEDLERHCERGWGAFFFSELVELRREAATRSDELAALLEDLEPTPPDADLAYL